MTDRYTATFDETAALVTVGFLGAEIADSTMFGVDHIHNARLAMIEMRILRIEQAMRDAGIDVNALPLANEGVSK